MKRANGCGEHALILNKLSHGATQRHEEFVVTAIVSTNALGSMLSDLIRSVMAQKGFPKRT
jgi:hypothetical protein